jgi:hypothetical protein
VPGAVCTVRKKPTRRKRVGKGIYRDAYGLSAVVKVGPRDGALQREKRYPFDTTHETIREWQEATRVELRQKLRRPVLRSPVCKVLRARTFDNAKTPQPLRPAGMAPF